MSWQYAAAGIAVAVIVAAGVFVWLNLGNSKDTKAASKEIIYSAQSGDWSKSTSWTPRGPVSGDSIVLKKGHTITLDKSQSYEGIKLGVYGILWIDQASKLYLSKEAKIEVFAGGTIDSGKSNDGTRIEYDGKAIWTSKMGAVAGYNTLDKNGYDPEATLPIILAYFKVKPEGGKVNLEWATEAEENNDFFTIERSADGKAFETVATIDGAGNSKVKLTYTYTDAAPLAGKSYYRLKQTDFDGKFETFKLELVESKGAPAAVASEVIVQKVGPNPFQHTFYVDFELGVDGPVEISLMNMNGQVVVTQKIDGYAGNNRYNFNDEKGLLKGTYILNLAQNNIATKPIRLIKN